MKILITLIFTLTSFATFAQDNQRFEQQKQALQKATEARQQILAQEQKCINSAKNKEDLKNCLHSAKEQRKEMTVQIKENFKKREGK